MFWHSITKTTASVSRYLPPGHSECGFPAFVSLRRPKGPANLVGMLNVSHITPRYHGSPHRTGQCSQWSGVHVCLRKRACSISQAQSTRRVYGVLRHVLANGSASFQSHPNHANTFRPNPADRAIPHTKDLRAETGSFGAFEPNTFTCARCFSISRARERVWKGMCQLPFLAVAGMIGREGSSRLHHSDQEMGYPSVLKRRLLGAAA